MRLGWLGWSQLSSLLCKSNPTLPHMPAPYRHGFSFEVTLAWKTEPSTSNGQEVKGTVK